MIPVVPFDPARQRIGLHSPSGPIGRFPRRQGRAVTELRRRCAQGVVFAGNALSVGQPWATAAARRAADLMELVASDDVGLILATTGGYLSLCTLQSIDFDVIAAAAKPIVGFSDTTALLLGLYARTGLVTFHGPSLLATFGEPDCDDFSWDALLRVVSRPGGIGELVQPASGNHQFRFWDKEDDGPACFERLAPPATLFEGTAVGPLIGGNLETLVALACTPYMPRLDGAILFWEAAFCGLDKLVRELFCLEAAGVLAKLAGMVVCAPFCIADATEVQVYEIARQFAERHRIPTLAGVMSGHQQPITTLPIGVRARLDAERRSLHILESAIRADR